MSNNQAVAQAGAEQEIDEIMKEIRNLQDSISQTPAAEATPEAEKADSHLQLVPAPAAEAPKDEMADFRGAGGGGGGGGDEGPSLEETMAQMKGDPEAKTLFDEENSEKTEEKETSAEEETVSDEELAEVIDQIAEEARSNDSEGDSSASEEDGSLSMTLSGKMSLQLKYAFGDHSVKLRFQDHALVVEMTDGMELKIPLRPKKSSRAA